MPETIAKTAPGRQTRKLLAIVGFCVLLCLMLNLRTDDVEEGQTPIRRIGIQTENMEPPSSPEDSARKMMERYDSDKNGYLTYIELSVMEDGPSEKEYSMMVVDMGGDVEKGMDETMLIQMLSKEAASRIGEGAEPQGLIDEGAEPEDEAASRIGEGAEPQGLIDEGAEPEEPPSSPEDSARKMMEMYDSDKNGYLTYVELSVMEDGPSKEEYSMMVVDMGGDVEKGMDETMLIQMLSKDEAANLTGEGAEPQGLIDEGAEPEDEAASLIGEGAETEGANWWSRRRRRRADKARCTCSSEGRKLNSVHGDWCYLREKRKQTSCEFLDGAKANQWTWTRCVWKGVVKVDCGQAAR